MRRARILKRQRDFHRFPEGKVDLLCRDVIAVVEDESIDDAESLRLHLLPEGAHRPQAGREVGMVRRNWLDLRIRPVG